LEVYKRFQSLRTPAILCVSPFVPHRLLLAVFEGFSHQNALAHGVLNRLCEWQIWQENAVMVYKWRFSVVAAQVVSDGLPSSWERMPLKKKPQNQSPEAKPAVDCSNPNSKTCLNPNPKTAGKIGL
jgi:hypothetical protein